METLAIKALTPVDAASAPGGEGDAATADGQSFVAALSGVMDKQADSNAPAEDTTARPAEVTAAEAREDSQDPAAALAFMLMPFSAVPGRLPTAATPDSHAAASVGIDADRSASQGRFLAADAPAPTIAGAPGSFEAMAAAECPDPVGPEHVATLTTGAANRTLPQAAPADMGAIEPSRSTGRAVPPDRAVPQPAVLSSPVTAAEPGPAESAAPAQASPPVWTAEALAALTRLDAPAPGSAPAAAVTLAPRVGTAGWSEAMGQRIVFMAAEGIQQAELKLNPEGLGPLQVVLSIDQGAADVQFRAHDPQVREALQSALPRLQEMLASAGFSLDRVSIDAGSARNQDSQGNGQPFPQHRGREAADGEDSGSVTLPVAGIPIQVRPGRIDTFA